jgi:hypothetical protein
MALKFAESRFEKKKFCWNFSEMQIVNLSRFFSSFTKIMFTTDASREDRIYFDQFYAFGYLNYKVARANNSFHLQ